MRRDPPGFAPAIARTHVEAAGCFGCRQGRPHTQVHRAAQLHDLRAMRSRSGGCPAAQPLLSRAGQLHDAVPHRGKRPGWGQHRHVLGRRLH